MTEFDDPTMELVLVTPEMATAWLAKNLRNRRLRPPHVDVIARVMASGSWMVTGESIKFDRDGNRIDGQHRLKAIVQSGVSVWVFVVRGLHPDVQYVLDTGKKRSAAEALGFVGYSCTSTLAAAARISISWDEGVYKYAGQSANGREITNVEIVDWVNRNKDMLDAVVIGEQVRRQSPIPGGVASSAALLFQRIDADDAVEFFSRITQLRTSGEGDPFFALLNRYRTATARREALATPQHLFILIRTWNAFRTGEQLIRLKIGDISTPTGSIARTQIPKPV